MDFTEEMNALSKEEETVNSFLCLLLPSFSDANMTVEYKHLDKVILDLSEQEKKEMKLLEQFANQAKMDLVYEKNQFHF
jgi:hypothetical protein